MTSLNNIIAHDLTACLQDGVPVEYNGLSTFGIPSDEPTEVLQMNSKSFAVQSTTKTLTIVTDSLGPLKATKAGSVEYITVDGIKYRLDRFIKLTNGLESKLWLSGAD